jgi:hypothetical protein
MKHCPMCLAFVPFGLLQRNTRHHFIRSLIATELRNLNLEVYEEIHVNGQNDSNRRIDIFAMNQSKEIGYIIDPTIRMEYSNDQALLVNEEKKNIYTPCVQDIKLRYKFKHNVEVIGLFIGARGTITKFCEQVLTKQLKLPKEICNQIALAAVKGSVSILKHHLYNPTN